MGRHVEEDKVRVFKQKMYSVIKLHSIGAASAILGLIILEIYWGFG